jgi:hypothetical protein
MLARYGKYRHPLPASHPDPAGSVFDGLLNWDPQFRFASLGPDLDLSVLANLSQIQRISQKLKCCRFFSLKILNILATEKSGLDPDSMGSPDPASQSGSGSRRAKITHKNRKKIINLIFLSAVCSIRDYTKD